jgi:hypothetical protein
VTYLRRYRGDPKHDAPGISELLQEGPQVFGKNFLKSRPLFGCTCTSSPGHDLTAFALNSAPLSDLMYSGLPLEQNSSVSV